MLEQALTLCVYLSTLMNCSTFYYLSILLLPGITPCRSSLPQANETNYIAKAMEKQGPCLPILSPSRVFYQYSFRKGHGPWKWSWYIHIFYYYLFWGRTKWRVVLCPGTNYELPRDTELLLFSRPIFRCVSANKEPFVITVVVITSYCRRFYFVRSRIRRWCVHLQNPDLYKSILEKNLQLSNNP